MSKSKPKVVDLLEEPQTTKLDEELLDEFTEELETAINQVCERNHAVDPRLELLVTLGLFGAQVAIDSGFDKEEFLRLMEEMYDDFEGESEVVEVVVMDKSKVN